MLRNTVLFIAVVACVTIWISCSSSTNRPSIPQFAEKKFTVQWSMDEKAFNIFRMRVNAIVLGEDISQIIAKLGVPDDDKTEKKNEQVRLLTYYVTRQRADSALNSDKIVLVGLNAEGKVKAIYSNVDGITTRSVGNRPLQ